MATLIVGTGETYTTIASAIAAANSGDTIQINAGTYNENITVDKGLTFVGANVGIVGTGVRGAESILTWTGLAIDITTSEQVSFDGLRFDGEQVMRAQSVADAKVTFQNSTFDLDLPGGASNSFYLNSPDSFTFSRNFVETTGYNSAFFQPVGTAGSPEQSVVTITDNTFLGHEGTYVPGDDNDVPVIANLSDVSGVVSGNTFDNVDIGVLVANGAGPLEITDNTFQNLHRDGVETAGGFAAGVVLFQPNFGQEIAINNNTFADSDAGIRTSGVPGSNTSGLPVTIDSNEFNNVDNPGFQPGAVDGPLYFTNSTGTSSPGANHVYAETTITVDDSGGADHMTIQAAIDAASDGDVIVIAAGSYAENITITKKVTLIGEGDGDDVVIQGAFKSLNGLGAMDSVADFLKTTPTDYNAGAGKAVIISADNVGILNLKISGYNTGIEFSDGVDHVLIQDVSIDATVNGYRKGTEADVTYLNVLGGSITDSYIGLFFAKTTSSGQAGNGLADHIVFDGTTFTHLVEKGLYFEALSNALLTNLTMTNVGEYGRGTAPVFGGGVNTGGFGNGIDINLKNGSYSNIVIDGFTFTDVGSSNKDGAGSDHNGGGAIVIKARDDAPSYNSTPATYTGEVIVQNGTIDGTSTGIRAGEPGKNIADPAVTVTDVDIQGATHNADHGDVDNVTQSTMTVNLEDGGDSLIAREDATGSFVVNGGNGADTISTGGGADTIDGAAGNDTISGQDGGDTLTGGTGNDSLQGGNGTDAAVYDGPVANYAVTYQTSPGGFVTGFTQIQESTVTGTDEGTDTLTDVEQLSFNGGATVLDLADPVQLFDTGGKLIGTFDSIQGAIDAASDGQTIKVGAGTYNESLTVDVEVTIQGMPGAILEGPLLGQLAAQGYTPGTPLNEFFEALPHPTYVSSTAFNVTADNVTISGFTVTSYALGVLLNTSDGVSVLNNEFIDNVRAVLNDTANDGLPDDITNFEFSGNTVSQGVHGVVISTDANGLGSFDNITMDNNDFSDLSEKGIYFEMISHASATGNTFDDVGNYGRISPPFGGTDGAFGSAIELNLKFQEFTDVTFTDTEITNSGHSDKSGMGSPAASGNAVSVKTRNDSVGPPVSFDGAVVFDGLSIDGTSTGIRIGEPAKNNLGPDVEILDLTISNATVGDIDNATHSTNGATVTVDLADGQVSLDASDSQAPVDVTGNSLDNTISTGSGADTISGGGGEDTLNGNNGADELNGGADNDELNGGAGDDTLNGDGGNDELNAGADNDQLTGGAGNDALDGGAGTDTAVYTGDVSVGFGAGNWTVNGGGAEGNDTLTNVEIVDDGVGGRVLLVGNGGYASIADAIGAASNGDTIMVAAGIWDLPGGDSGLQLTFLGANAGISANDANGDANPARVAETIIDGSGTDNFRFSSTGLVTFDGFTFTGQHFDSYETGNDIAFRNNVITEAGSGQVLFAANSDTVTFENNRITDVTYAGFDLVMLAGNWDGTTGTTIDITGNVVAESAGISGFNLSNVTGTIADNVIDGISYYGFLLANGTDVDVTGNTFSNIVNPDPVGVPTWGAGIRTFTPTSEFGLNLDGNTFEGNAVGLGIRVGSDINPLNIAITNNTFTDNGHAVVNQGTATTDVTLAGNNTIDTVLLSDATDAELLAIADDIVDAIDNAAYGEVVLKDGFHYVTSNSFLAPGTTAADIQRAIDAAEAGDTIVVAAGTYTGEVTVNKQVTIIGANAGITGDGVRGPESSLTGGFIITADGVVIDGMEILQGREDFGQQQSGIFISGAHDNITIQNTIIDSDGANLASFKHGIVTTFGADTDGLQVLGNHIVGWNEGIYFNPGVHDSTIDNNTFDDNGNHLITDNPDDLTISNNEFGDSDGSQIAGSISNNPTDLEVELGLSGNTFLNAAKFAWFPFGNVDNHVIQGTSFRDRIFGDSVGNFAQTLEGRGGDDLLVGGDGADTLDGGTGNDTATYDGNDVSIAGGANTDTLVVNSGVTIDLANADQSGGGDTANVTGFENVDASGSAAAVNLTGNAGENELTGGTADDTLNGGGNNDALEGGAGTDTAVYTANLSADDFSYNGGTNEWTVDTGGAEGTDTLVHMEKVDDQGTGNFLLVDPDGSYTTIQAAIDAAASGDTILVASDTYVENLTLNGKGLHFVSVGGDVTIQSAAGGTPVVTISGDHGGASTSFTGFVFTGATGAGLLAAAGVKVDQATNIATLSFDDSEFSGNGGYGLVTFSADIDQLNVRNTDFSNNAQNGVNSGAHIKLFEFEGNALLQNVNIEGAPDGTLNQADRPDFGIEVHGRQNSELDDVETLDDAVPPIGTFVIDNVTISGEFHKTPVAINNFSNVNGLSITDLDLSTAEAFWGALNTASYLFNMDGISDDIDLADYGVTFNSSHPFASSLIGEHASQTAFAQTIEGGAGNDRLDGNKGNDTLEGNGGSDLLIGDAGIDTASYAPGLDASDFTYNAGTKTWEVNDGQGGTDVLTGIERATDGTNTFILVGGGSEYTTLAQGKAAVTGGEIVIAPDVMPTAPVDEDGDDNEVDESAVNGTEVQIDVKSTDAETNVTYSITADTSDGGFAIDADTGVVTVADGSKLDFEMAIQHTIEVTATNEYGNSKSSEFTIDLNNVAPTLKAGNSLGPVAEGNTLIGSVVEAGSDGNATYSILNNKDGALFSIDETTGVLSFNGAPDFENPADGNKDNKYVVTVAASDGENNVIEQFTIEVTDEDLSAVTDGDAAANKVQENATNGKTVGITAQAKDGAGPVDFSLDDDAGGRFQINASTGVVTVKNGALLDFEDETSWDIVVKATEGVDSTTETFTIQITDQSGNTINGTKGADNINGTTGPGNVTPADPSTSSVVATGEADTINGGDGNDTIDGLAGDDVLTGGKGDDVLIGGAGNDTLTGNAGKDNLSGGDHDDTLQISGSDDTNDVLNGNAGTDTLKVLGTASVVLAGFDAMKSSIDNWIGNGKGVLGTSGADVFDISGLASIAGLPFIDGAAGNDKLVGSDFADDLRGGAGDDEMDGGEGNNVLTGGAGADQIDGGDDTDTASYATSGAGVTINLDVGSVSGGDAKGDVLSNIENLEGSKQKDALTGDDDDNVLSGGSGDDTLNGGDGNDILVGGAGKDTLIGGKGDDTVQISGSNDVNDTFFGGADTNTIQVTGAGAVTLAGFNGSTLQFQNWDGNGASLLGTSGSEIFDFTDVSVSDLDFVDAGGGDDIVVGSDDGLDLRGNAGNDALTGGAGNDTLHGGMGTDTLNGGAGDDLLQISGTEGQDVVNGGADNDTLQVIGKTAVTLNGFDATALQIEVWSGNNQGLMGTAGANTFDLSGLTSVSGLKFVDGAAGNDTITGTSSADDLRGNAGNDTLNGGAGNDTLNGGAGKDTVNGDAGDDVIQITGTEAQTDDIKGGADIDTIKVLGGGAVTLEGFDAFDQSIEIWSGNKQGLMGTAGNNVLDLDDLTTVTDLKFVDGGAGNDSISGTIFADDLRGGTGNDDLNGNLGNDKMTGGAGNDTFVFEENFNTDTVADYQAGKDTILILHSEFDEYSDLQAVGVMTQQGANVHIDLTDGDVIIISKTTIAFLDAHSADFAFGP